ncbi:YkgB family protein [Pseudomonas vranovensis]|uniref:YkgB family protein n=1 Tax=Pseudomonas vranovensis TaxID=321661 RepID=UPI003D95BCB2
MTRPTYLDRFIRSSLDIQLLRWSLILIFFGFGYAKWFDYEAQALIPLIDNSPLLSWLHLAFGIHGASYALGVAEWAIGTALLAGIWQPRLAVIGALGSVLTYATTLTLIVTTPGGWENSAGGFPAMGGATSFLIKDAVLLAASVALLKHDLQRYSPTPA